MVWGGLGREKSVYKQPGTRVDGIAPHKRRDSKYVKGTQRTKGIGKRGIARGIKKDCTIT